MVNANYANIYILVRDFYFSLGLKFVLSEYFEGEGKNVRFINEDELSMADVIFCEQSNSMLYFAGRNLKKNVVVFFLAEKENRQLVWRLSSFQQVLSKKMCLQEFYLFWGLLWRERLICKRHISSPEEQLTSRQQQIMRLLAEGLTPAEISMRLNISIKTVSSHRGAVMKKLGFNRKVELYNWLILRGNEL